MNGISFRYECPYFKNTATESKRQYRPDFTIYFQQNGRPVFVILEHFGIDANGNVPRWFGEGKKVAFTKQTNSTTKELSGKEKSIESITQYFLKPQAPCSMMEPYTRD